MGRYLSNEAWNAMYMCLFGEYRKKKADKKAFRGKGMHLRYSRNNSTVLFLFI